MKKTTCFRCIFIRFHSAFYSTIYLKSWKLKWMSWLSRINETNFIRCSFSQQKTVLIIIIRETGAVAFFCWAESSKKVLIKKKFSHLHTSSCCNLHWWHACHSFHFLLLFPVVRLALSMMKKPEKTCFLPIFLDTCIASFFPAFQFSACALILIILAVFCDKKQHIFSPFSLGRIALLECKYNFFPCCNALCFFTFVHILVMLSWTGQCQSVIGLFFYFSKSFGFILDDRAKRTCSHPSTSTSQWTEGEFDAREQKKNRSK